MEELKNTEFEKTQYIVIKIGQEQYGIDIKFIDNIVRLQHITRVPKVPVYLKGVINLRGEVLPVKSIRLKMGMEEDEYTKNSRIIILKVEGFEKTGIIVDEVREVITLDSSQVEKTIHDAKDEKANYVQGVGKYNNDLISLLDLNVILSDKDN